MPRRSQYPTDEWLSRCRELEAAFCTYYFLNQDSLSRDSDVIINVVNIIVAQPGAVDVRRGLKIRFCVPYHFQKTEFCPTTLSPPKQKVYLL